MNEEQAGSLKEIWRIIRVLERMGELTKQASRTGALQDGKAYAIQQYNAIIEALAALGIEIPGYFPPITPDAGLGAVGFASAQLAEYLSELVEGESKRAAEGGAGGEGSFFNQFFGSGEFQHIGEAMRQAIPDWARETRQARAEREARRSRERSRGAAAEAHEAPPRASSPDERGAAAELQGRLAEISARMVAAAEQMRRPDQSSPELQRLAAELARLAEEQARIVRETESSTAAGGHVEADVEV